MLDVDRDGWTDVFVTNDGVPNFLFRNKGDGTFDEVGARSPASRCRRTGARCRAWASTRRTTTATAPPTSP